MLGRFVDVDRPGPGVDLPEQAGGGEGLKDLANSLADLTQKYGRTGLDSMIDAFE